MPFPRVPLALAALVLAIAVGACSEPTPDPAAVAAEEQAAEDLVAEAIALYRDEGPEEAFGTMNSAQGGFRRGELYIFVIDPDDMTVVHAGDAALIGRNADNVMDADGQPMGPILRAAATEQGGWAEYRFRDPEDGDVEPKRSWVVLEDGYIFGAGVYEHAR